MIDLGQLNAPLQGVPDDPRLGGLEAHVSIVPASVCWGAPSGRVEAELFPDFMEMTPETIQELEKRLPLLYDALVKAVRRGQPINQASRFLRS